jgi:hypothetical protein
MESVDLILVSAALLAALVIAYSTLYPGTFTPEMTKGLCQDSDGVWNECGSACLGEPPGTICTKECVPTCGCFSNFQCPPGYFCRQNSPQEKGACKPI